MHNDVSDALINEPLQSQADDDMHEEQRDTVQLNADDSVMSSQGPIHTNEMPSDDDLETYRIVFELFDRDRSGYIDNHDLAAISVKLGKDPSEGKSVYHP